MMPQLYPTIFWYSNFLHSQLCIARDPPVRRGISRISSWRMTATVRSLPCENHRTMGKNIGKPWRNGGLPSGNIYITMGNHNCQWENWLFLWPFSMAMSKYQRVTNQKRGFNWCLVFFKRFLEISWLSWNTTNNILWTIGRFETKTGLISCGCICNSMVDQRDVCNARHDFARTNWACSSNNENCSVFPMKIYRRIQWYNIIIFHAIRMGAQTQQTHKNKPLWRRCGVFFCLLRGVISADTLDIYVRNEMNNMKYIIISYKCCILMYCYTVNISIDHYIIDIWINIAILCQAIKCCSSCSRGRPAHPGANVDIPSVLISREADITWLGQLFP